MIDLHLHSACSDGTLTPGALYAAAAAAGLAAAALTDHETVQGLGEWMAAARKEGPRAIPGVEIGAQHSPGEMHVLGYGIREADAAFRDWLAALRKARFDRNRQILERLARLGMPIDETELEALTGAGVVGRLHIAEWLVRHRYARDTAEAFDRWLGRDAPAYVPRPLPTPEACIEAIRAAGGVAVLAHPVSLGLERSALIACIRRLKDAGLRGLEVWHPHHTPAHRRAFLVLARNHGLVPTGGSDYHGARSPTLRIGIGAGDLRVPDDVLDRLFDPPRAAGAPRTRSALA